MVHRYTLTNLSITADTSLFFEQALEDKPQVEVCDQVFADTLLKIAVHSVSVHVIFLILEYFDSNNYTA